MPAAPMTSVNLSRLLRKINGPVKSFQANMKLKIATVAIAGFESGMMIVHQIRKRPAPSISAASSSSIGNVRKNCRSMKM